MKKFVKLNQFATVLVGSSLFLIQAHASIVISEIDLANNRVELINTGTSSVDMSAWQWCNRLNGSPFYGSFTAGMINSTYSTAGVGLSSFSSGAILTFDFTNALLPDALGEFGLYSSAAFGSSAAIVDYLAWGANGVRDSVADAAGIWANSSFLDVSNLAAGETIQLGSNSSGNDVGSYFVTPTTIGAVNTIPEPTASILVALGVGVSVCRRTRS